MARHRYDDDDDDDDRPRRRRTRDDDDDDDDDRRSSGGSGAGLLIVGGIIACVLLFGGIAAVAFWVLRTEDKPAPEVAEQPPAVAPPFVQPVPPGPQPLPKIVPPEPLTKPKEKPSAKLPTPDLTKLPVGIVAIPPLNPLVTQIVFAGGLDGYAAIISYMQMGAGKQIDVVKSTDGEVKGQIRIDSLSDNGFAVSPDGRWLAINLSAPFDGHSVALYSVANAQEVARFTPYSRKGPQGLQVPELVWIEFVTKDLLLTINAGGGFDLWSVPGMKRTAGVAPMLTGGARIGVNGFTHSPENFGLSNDGKTLAIFNGAGFTFYDAATATEIARTPEFTKPGGSALFSGAAISPDGKRFASYYQLFGATSGVFLPVWDTNTGQRVAGGPIKDVNAPAGLGWWGQNHLVFWEGGISSARVFSLESGQNVATLRTSIPGKFGTVPPNGQLWGVVGGSGYEPQTGAAYLVRADPGIKIASNAKIDLTPTGMQVK